LRESPSALARADLILLDADGAARADLSDAHPGRVLRLRRRVLGFYGLDGIERPAPARPFLLSGIARPERFHGDVMPRVGHVAGTAVFADHHAYTATDVAAVESRARAAGADAIVATANLRQAFPHWDDVRRLRTARQVYAHFGQVLLEILWLRGRSRDEVLRLVEVVGREHVEAAFAGGRGVMCVTAHIGNWEMHGLAHGWLFGPISVVARPIDNPDLHRRLNEVRTTGGNAVIDKRHALAQIMRGLKENRGIAILIDQNVQAQD